MGDFASRLKEVREELGFTIPDFAASLGYDVSNYRKVEKGKFLLPPEKQEVLCTLHGISLNWLLVGFGGHYVSGEKSQRELVLSIQEAINEANSHLHSINSEKTSIPNVSVTEIVSLSNQLASTQKMLSRATADAEHAAEKYERARKELELFYREPGEPNVFDLETPAAAGRAITLLEEDKTRIKPNLYLPELGDGIHIRVPTSGDSMYPTIRQNDKIVGTWHTDGPNNIQEGDAYIIIGIDDGVVVKRIFYETGKYFRLVSDNESVQPYPVSAHEIRAIFRVRQIHRSSLDPDSSEILKEFNRIRTEWATFKVLFQSKT